jgi:hypothetical protein
MGFHVTLREADDRLLRQVARDPAAVFGRPYAGYFLFLAAATDGEAVNWLRAHLQTLDSVTREHVAYAIFAESIRVKLDLNGDTSAKRPQTTLRPLSINDVLRIDELFQRGTLGQVTDGDALAAISYGTDRVAKHFGVLAQLPCMIVLDGTGEDTFLVVELCDSTLKELIRLIRLSMDRLLQAKHLALFVGALEIRGKAEDEISRLSDELLATERELADVESLADRCGAVEKTLRDKLARGTHRGFRSSLRQAAVGLGAPLDFDLDEATGSTLASIAKTLRVLEVFLADGDLSVDVQRQGVERVLGMHVMKLCPDHAFGTPVTRVEIELAVGVLRSLQDLTIRSVLTKLSLRAHVAGFVERRQGVLTERRAGLETMLNREKEAARQSDLLLSEQKGDSFVSIVHGVLREHKISLGLKRLREVTVDSMKGLLKPETIFKVLGALHYI